MTIYYSDTYTVDLPPEHRFPMEKYRMLRDALLASAVIDATELHESIPATRDQLILAHTSEYVDAFTNGSVDPRIVRRIGIPWSPAFVRRSYASVGGTIAAARAALSEGIAGNLAGGTHHAMRDRGEGYCVFNDIATAGLLLLADGAVKRVAVVDLDVHQGNGTADILGGDPRVFTLSVHGEKNFPFTKVASTLDIGLEDGTGDREYLAALTPALEAVQAFDPDIVFYQGGVDPLECDRLGRLSLTHEGLMERDHRVMSSFECPVVITLGGGYAVPISETVRAHVNTYRTARSY